MQKMYEKALLAINLSNPMKLRKKVIKIKMKNAQNNFIEGIGNTPLIKLKAASEITGCNIYGKAEYLNPGGSVKDRAALALIKDAEEKKLIFRHSQLSFTFQLSIFYQLFFG